MLTRAEVLQSKTNVNVLNKTLKRLQVEENSINFAAESNNGCEVTSTANEDIDYIFIFKIKYFHLLQAWSIVMPFIALHKWTVDTSPVRTRDFSGWGFSFPPQPNVIINNLNLELL